MERDELYQKFAKAIQEVQQKSGFKNLLLERKLGTLTDTLEKKEAQLYVVLSASNMDPAALGGVTHKLEVLCSPCVSSCVNKSRPNQYALCFLSFFFLKYLSFVVLWPYCRDTKTNQKMCFCLQEVLDSKNISIKDLQYEIARVCKVSLLSESVFMHSLNITVGI